MDKKPVEPDLTPGLLQAVKLLRAMAQADRDHGFSHLAPYTDGAADRLEHTLTDGTRP